MGVLGYAELCREGIPPSHPVRAYLDGIVDEGERATALVNQLLALAQRQMIAPGVLDLNDAVASLLGRLRRLVGTECELSWAPGAGTMVALIDIAQLDQILAELCQNARDACQGTDRHAVICLKTVREYVDADRAPAFAEPGEYVVLTVEDNGRGMTDETRERLFEPFFTTASPAEHNGLGLAAVYGMVTQNGGFIEIDSAPDRGTCIHVYLQNRE